MELPGERRCGACGTRWSYFDTGSVACPNCGSLRSTYAGDGRVRHTDGAAALDLTAARSALEDDSLGAAADAAETATRRYLAGRGFIDAGELTPLDDAYVAAAELRHLAVRLGNGRSEPDESVASHFLLLLAAAPNGTRPESVPTAVLADRGMAVADAVARYRGAIRRGQEARMEGEGRRALDQLRAAERRVRALGGDVPPDEAGALLAAARAIGDAVRGDGDFDRAVAILDRTSITNGEIETSRDRRP